MEGTSSLSTIVRAVPAEGQAVPISSEESAALEWFLQYFGFPDFRAGQREAILAAVRGSHALVVMPTGSGKSACFQSTAIHLQNTRNQITVVVSPLIALMKDQADGLLNNGVWAVCVNSTLNPAQLRAAEEMITNGIA